MNENRCTACGGTEHMRGTSIWPSPHLICKPCFMVWYDPPTEFDRTDPKAVGELSMKLKAQGKFPWTGPYAPREAVDG